TLLARTTKSGTARTMYVALTRRPMGALVALGLLALASARAASSDASAAYAIADNADWKIAVSGAWAPQCPPTPENVATDGHDVRVNARSVLGLCARQSTHFSIEVDPALALNRSALAPGVYHVSFYAADGAQARQKLRAFTLLDHSAPDAPKIAPEAG